MAVFELNGKLYCADHGVCGIHYIDSLFALIADGRKKAAEQLHQYDVVRWMGCLCMLIIMPGKLRETRYKQLTETSVCQNCTQCKA